MERTLVLIKPDAIQRQLVGTILQRFENKGMKIAGLKMMQMSEDMAKDHYKDLVDKPFFPSLSEFMTSHPIIAIAIEGVGAVSICRKMTGATFGMKADPGTIRGDYGVSTSYNLIHSSEDKSAAERELKIFFKDEDFFSYNAVISQWVVTEEDAQKV
ncbi:nucleoside-diphosphate kinase [Candidatus Uabimicrobium sp. HlEnr_7]|uniref:nucleoside-diphosphate kinase n=1 Tax=Candidatus Uabimicrobium helgolandensis TaxID=3095367 RepID=UPI003558A442